MKKVARDLLDLLRAILLLDWQKTALSRARVRDAIEETLDAGLPRAYTPDVFKEKTGALFDHVYRRYGTAACGNLSANRAAGLAFAARREGRALKRPRPSASPSPPCRKLSSTPPRSRAGCGAWRWRSPSAAAA